jgi:hypothetical protein
MDFASFFPGAKLSAKAFHNRQQLSGAVVFATAGLVGFIVSFILSLIILAIIYKDAEWSKAAGMALIGGLLWGGFMSYTVSSNVDLVGENVAMAVSGPAGRTAYRAAVAVDDQYRAAQPTYTPQQPTYTPQQSAYQRPTYQQPAYAPQPQSIPPNTNPESQARGY